LADGSVVKLVRTNELLHAPVGINETVMLDTEAGKYFGLNEVGTYLWGLLEQPRSIPELYAAVCAEFDVAAAACEADVSTFLRSLMDSGLVNEIRA
jgi:hypothetical protein